MGAALGANSIGCEPRKVRFLNPADVGCWKMAFIEPHSTAVVRLLAISMNQIYFPFHQAWAILCFFFFPSPSVRPSLEVPSLSSARKAYVWLFGDTLVRRPL